MSPGPTRLLTHQQGCGQRTGVSAPPPPNRATDLAPRMLPRAGWDLPPLPPGTPACTLVHLGVSPSLPHWAWGFGVRINEVSQVGRKC